MCDPTSPWHDERLTKKGKGQITITAVAENGQKLKFFKLGSYKIYDSFQHLIGGLNTLMGSLDKSQMKHLRSIAPTDEKFSLILQKLPFPYEWFKELEQLDGPIPRDPTDYYSKLSLEMATSKEIVAYGRVLDAVGMKHKDNYIYFWCESAPIRWGSVIH